MHENIRSPAVNSANLQENVKHTLTILTGVEVCRKFLGLFDTPAERKPNINEHVAETN